MRVKMSKTCELEEVSELVVSALLGARRQLVELSERKFDYWRPDDLSRQISNLRFSLSDVDSILEEAQDIVTGYIDTINRLSVPPPEEPDEATDDTVDEEVENVQEEG